MAFGSLSFVDKSENRQLTLSVSGKNFARYIRREVFLRPPAATHSIDIMDFFGFACLYDHIESPETARNSFRRRANFLRVLKGDAAPRFTMPRFSNRRQTSGKSARSILSAQRISPQSARLSTSITSTLARDDRITFFDRLLEETRKRGIKYDCAGAHIYRGAPEYPRPTLDENYESLFAVFKKHGYENIDVYSPKAMHWLPVHCYDVPFITDLERRAKPLRGVLPYTYDIGHGERLATALRART